MSLEDTIASPHVIIPANNDDGKYQLPGSYDVLFTYMVLSLILAGGIFIPTLWMKKLRLRGLNNTLKVSTLLSGQAHLTNERSLKSLVKGSC